MKKLTLLAVLSLLATIGWAQVTHQTAAAQVGGAATETPATGDATIVQHVSPAIGLPALEVAQPPSPSAGPVQAAKPAIPTRGETNTDPADKPRQ